MPTIEVPTPSSELLASLETITIEANQAEAAAIAAIRERFAIYAKQNGYIRIARHQTYQGSGIEIADREWFLGWDGDYIYEHEGRRLKGLLAYSDFDQPNDTEFTGENRGWRLYLTERGEWLKITRIGRWSQWQGSPQWWSCGPDLDIPEADLSGADIRTLTDAEVADQCVFSELLKDLGQSMAEMCKKVPERYNRLKANAELAQRTIEALK